MSFPFSVPNSDHSRMSTLSIQREAESTDLGLFSVGKLKASTAGPVKEHDTFSNRVLSSLSQFAEKLLDLGIETSSEDSESRSFSDDSVHSFLIRFENEEQSVDDSRVSSLSQTRTSLSGANSTLVSQTRTSLSGASFLTESTDNSTAASKEDRAPILSSILGTPATSLVSHRAGADDQFSKAKTPAYFQQAPPWTNPTRCSTAGSSVDTSLPPATPTITALESKRIGQDYAKSPKEENTIIFVEAKPHMNHSSPRETSAKMPVENVYLSMHCPDNEHKADGLGETTCQPQHKNIKVTPKLPGQLAGRKADSPWLALDTDAAEIYSSSEASSVVRNKVSSQSQSQSPLLSAGSNSEPAYSRINNNRTSIEDRDSKKIGTLPKEASVIHSSSSNEGRSGSSKQVAE